MKLFLPTIILVFYISIAFVHAQHNAEFANMGADVMIEPGAIISVQGDVHNIGGLFYNDGFVQVQGNMYSDNSFQQRGSGTLRLENTDVNTGERQFISGSYAVRGGQAAIGIDDGSFFNLELANTTGYVYLSGNGSVADVRNTVDFQPGSSPIINNLVTHDIGNSGAIVYPANGALYDAVFGMMNNQSFNNSFLNNAVDVQGNQPVTDEAYVVGKLRRAIQASGGTYGFVVGLEPASSTMARGIQYMQLNFQPNTYDVLTAYYEQGSSNSATAAIECNGYLMDVFWGNDHGEWILEDINQVLGGEYDIQVWPQDPMVAWSGSAWTISKDDQFDWAPPSLLHNNCGPTYSGLQRGPFNGFSEFGLVSSNTFLPVELTDISAQAIENKWIEVQWQTATEKDVSHFELQRSTDGLEFDYLTTVGAVGNSLVPQYYKLDDYKVLGGINYYYRLKIVDNDGSFSFSKVVVSRINSAKQPSVVIAPNPVLESDLNIQIASFRQQPIQVQVFDAIGQLLVEKQYSVHAGINNINLNVEDWPQAVYAVSVYGDTFQEHLQFVKMKE